MMASPGTPVRRRAWGVVAVLVALAAVSACTNSGAPAAWNTPAPPPPAKLIFSHEPDAADVSPGVPAEVRVEGGTLDTVTLTTNTGEVEGAFSNDKVIWTSTQDLQYGKSYTLTVQATGLDGVVVQDTRTFTTRTVQKGFYWNAYFIANDYGMALDGGTYGVGQPVIVRFDDTVDRAVAEKTLTVTTDPPVVGAWHWFNNREVHWRPENYWQSGTKVTVTAKTLGVQLTSPDGRVLNGGANKSATFTIGQSKIAKIDDKTHRMLVFIDGVQVKDIPVSMGRPTKYTDTKGRVHDYRTTSGIFVVTEKHDPVKMVPDLPCPSGVPNTPGCDPGYYVEIIPNAVRITDYGEYVHAASWSVSDQGVRNVSHGCINISPANAAWFYDTFGAGDVVEIVNTGISVNLDPKTLGSERALDDGIADWSMPWDQWKAGSALPQTDPTPTVSASASAAA
jgi:lipoprotein-anchoring transpeptidase ErfK/SrfK